MQKYWRFAAQRVNASHKYATRVACSGSQKLDIGCHVLPTALGDAFHDELPFGTQYMGPDLCIRMQTSR